MRGRRSGLEEKKRRWRPLMKVLRKKAQVSRWQQKGQISGKVPPAGPCARHRRPRWRDTHCGAPRDRGLFRAADRQASTVLQRCFTALLQQCVLPVLHEAGSPPPPAALPVTAPKISAKPNHDQSFFAPPKKEATILRHSRNGANC